jgi:hypothetical protein
VLVEEVVLLIHQLLLVWRVVLVVVEPTYRRVRLAVRVQQDKVMMEELAMAVVVVSTLVAAGVEKAKLETPMENHTAEMVLQIL